MVEKENWEICYGWALLILNNDFVGAEGRERRGWVGCGVVFEWLCGMMFLYAKGLNDSLMLRLCFGYASVIL